MHLNRVRFTTRKMMIAIACLTVLAVVGMRVAYAGLLFGLSFYQEREETRKEEEAHRLSKTESPPFDDFQEKVANFHARLADYHCKCKWLYLRAMFVFWAEIPRRPPAPEIRYPFMAPPRPLPARTGTSRSSGRAGVRSLSRVGDLAKFARAIGSDTMPYESAKLMGSDTTP
jgi:hypothetical protein